MTERRIGWTAAIILLISSTARAGEPIAAPVLTVCLTISPALEMAPSLRMAALEEVKRIWQPMGITVGLSEEFASSCERWILVKSALEAGPEDAASDHAIAWVPFVAKRARRVIFVRMSHARALIEVFQPTNMRRPAAQTDSLLSKLVGRSLAHELGHVLLNTLDHENSGLMRARFGANDTLRDLPSAYTLNPRQLSRLLAVR